MMLKSRRGTWGGVIVLVTVFATWAAAQQIRPPAIAHEPEGMEDCTMCHMVEAESHEGLENNVCLWCHAADSPMQTADPPMIPHDVEGQGDCLMCHTAGAMEGIPDVPEHHEGMASENCTMCHKKAEGG
jgi:hypothetical protein